jgi:hypothetical protein
VSEAGDYPVFFYTSEDSVKTSRLRYHLKTKYAGKYPMMYVVIDKSPGFSTMKAHAAYFGIPDDTLVQIESLPKPPRQPRDPIIRAAADAIYYTSTDFLKANGRSSYWYKKSHTFDPTETYYYVDFKHSNPMFGSKEIEGCFETVVRYLVKKKALPDNISTVYGINKKNRFVLKIGTWVNIFKDAATTIKGDRTELEKEYYLREMSTTIGEFSALRRQVDSVKGFMSYVKNQDTIKMFNSFMELYKRVENVKSDIQDICQFFEFTPNKHDLEIFDLEEFRKILSEKYRDLFTMIDNVYFYNKADVIGDLINFIDEKT